MKKNGEYVGVDDKYIPEDEKYVDESLLGDKRKAKKTAMTVIIVYFLIVILFVVFIFTMFRIVSSSIVSNFDKTTKNMEDSYEEKVKSMKEAYDAQANETMNFANNIMSNYGVDSFNTGLESMQGTKSKFMLSGYLDNVVTSNKKNAGHIITVTYNETTTTEEDGIVKIKHSLKDDKQYEVSIGYDTNGYINKVSIKEI